MNLRSTILLIAAAVARAECLPVSGELILARDLARAIPGFAATGEETVLGHIGAGQRRAYAFPELARLAQRYGFTVEPGTEVCFFRPLETLTADRVASALAIAIPGARIEILDFSRQPVPPGELRLPLSGMLLQGIDTPVCFKGVIAASGQPDFPVWVKARVRIPGRRTIAAEALASGQPIRASQIREEDYVGTPGLPEAVNVIGRIPRRPIPAGTVIREQWLQAPAEVFQGERVRMEVRSGAARVLLDVLAQSTARRGEVIAVRNPANGKILRARVVDRGYLMLETDLPGARLVESETP